MPADSLETIGSRHGTDKSRQLHGYLDFYERFLGELRERPVTLLEIGVLEGQSLRMWRDYFRNGRVIGVDIDPTVRRHAGERIAIEIADQSNVADLVRLGVRHGPFDVVIDDGSHIWEHQITALRYLFPFVKPGGFFIVEDLHTSYGALAEGFRGGGTVPTARYLQGFCDYMVGDEALDIGAAPDAFIRSYARATEFVAFHRRTALMRLRTDPAWPAPLAVVAPAEGGAAPAIALTAHLAFRGDEMREDGTGGRRYSHQSIQGFAITLPDAAADLQYRAVLHDHTWTDWSPGGTFLGSRGKSVALRGFAVRLAGELARRYHCVYAGAFVGATEPVIARDGGECRTPDGAELEAMQVRLQPRTDQPGG